MLKTANAIKQAARCRCQVRRQGAAAGCARHCPYGGRAAAGTGKPWLVDKAFYAAHNKRGRQGAAAGCARQCPSGGRAGGKHRQRIGRSAELLTRRTNKAAIPFTRHISKATSPFTRRTTSAVSAANECEGITCHWQVTRNDSDEAERSERSPSGVVSVANDEELTGAARQVSGEAAPASGSALQPDRPPPPARGAGGRARRPPEPSAGRRCGAHYPPGSQPVLVLKSCYPPGTLPALVAMQSRV